MADIGAVSRAPVYSADELQALSDAFEKKPAQAVLAWALERFHPRFALSSSFGAEDVAVIDMLWRLNPKARVVTLDTLRLPKETYEVIERIQDKYGIQVEVYRPQPQAVAEMVSQHGLNLMYESIDKRKLCCHIRKVEPLERALVGLDAWAAGLRRQQASTRTDVKKIELDPARPDKIKINPIADWTWEQVWAYIREHQVPYNALHDKNYPSIGCDPCTRPVRPGEDPRAGRWWWELDPTQKECGLHVAEPPPSLTPAAKT
ncbi:MAG: phosphoadenylyl-sulfate reductase [Chloroflexi bacterium]|nr:phosphoadenylyl-sulfate reductase [Chloroflexota bacterium]